MAKLPGAPDLGETPGFGPRPIGNVDVSGFARGGAAIAQGAQALGAGIAKAGEGYEAYQLDKGRWEYAKAHANLAGGAFDIQDGLAKDTNYGVDDSGKAMPQRYADRYRELQSQSADMISDPRMRERFMFTTQPLVEQHAKQADQHARGLENNASDAYVRKLELDFGNKAVAAPDDATRTGLIYSVIGRPDRPGVPGQPGLIDGLGSMGVLSPTQVLARKQAWAQQYAAAKFDSDLDSGDPLRMQAAITQLRQAPGAPDDITSHILQAEGEGQNPRSTAMGVGQFTNEAWLETVKKNRPDLAAGRSDQDILALRADRGLGREMTEAYRAGSEAYLRNKGIDPTPGAQYLAHFLGRAGAVAVLQADPKQPVVDALAKVVGPDKAKAMVTANPEVLGGQLAGSVAQWADSKMGGSGGSSGSIADLLPLNVRRQLIARGVGARAEQLGIAIEDAASGRAPLPPLETIRNDPLIRGTAHEVALTRQWDVAEREGETRRREDPAGVVDADPAVQTAKQGYDPTNPATFHAVAQARLDAQEALGIDPAYRSPITRQEALKLTQPLHTMLPGEEHKVLKGIAEKFKTMFGPDAPQAFAYAIRSHRVDAETARYAGTVMRGLGLGTTPVPEEAAGLDNAKETAAAENAVSGRPDISRVPPAVYDAAAIAAAEGGVARPGKPQGPNLPVVPPRAIQYLLEHQDTIAEFDKQYGRPGLAKSILEKYAIAAGAKP